MSERPVQILMVEDSESDVDVIVHTLRKMGRLVECERVDHEASMRAALATRTWDVILSDWSLPTFSGLAALALARAVDPDVPFIIVSGTIGDGVAVEGMRAGAQDYVLKDNLLRLVPAVERELRDSVGKRQRRRTEEALRLSEARFRRLSESGIVGIAIADVRGNLSDANQALLDMVGYSRDEMLRGAVHWTSMTPQAWRPSAAGDVGWLPPVAPLDERELVRKSGPPLSVLIGSALLDYPMCISFVVDLTQRRTQTL